MRLRDIQEILQQALSVLPFATLPPEGVPGGGARFTRRAEVISALHNLSTIPGFTETSNLSEIISEGSAPNNSIVLDANKASAYTHGMNLLLTKTKLLHQAINANIAPESPLSFSIKLPQIDNIEELGKFFGRISIAFAQPLSRLYGEHIRFHGFDTGSSWIEVVVASNVALGFIIGILKLSQQYCRMAVLNQEHEERVRQMKLDNDHLQNLQKTNAALLERFLKQHTEEFLEKQSPPNRDAEGVAFTLNAVKELSAMHREGVRIQLSLNAQPNMKAQFEEALAGSLPNAVEPPRLEAGTTNEQTPEK